MSASCLESPVSLSQTVSDLACTPHTNSKRERVEEGKKKEDKFRDRGVYVCQCVRARLRAGVCGCVMGGCGEHWEEEQGLTWRSAQSK